MKKNKKKKLKRSSNTPLNINLNLYVFDLINSGLSPAQISKKLNISKPLISYYTTKLKRIGWIKRIGYGVWKATEKGKKEVQITPHNACIKRGGVFAKQIKIKKLKQDSVRGHAFIFTLKISKIRNWDKREKYLNKKKIKYKKYNFGYSIKIKGFTVRLCKRSIVIYFPKGYSYFTETAKTSKSNAILEFISIIQKLETMFKTSFKINKQYAFKVSRQHYSLIKNALAKQYNKEGKKLHVYDKNGVFWLSIDDSFHMNELETLDKETSVFDNEIHQVYFNQIRDFKGTYTPQFVVNSLGNLSQNINHYSKNLASHVKAIKDLNVGVNKFTNKIDNLLMVLKPKIKLPKKQKTLKEFDKNKKMD